MALVGVVVERVALVGVVVERVVLVGVVVERVVSVGGCSRGNGSSGEFNLSLQSRDLSLYRRSATLTFMPCP